MIENSIIIFMILNKNKKKKFSYKLVKNYEF